jgi:hypothetical protein
MIISRIHAGSVGSWYWVGIGVLAHPRDSQARPIPQLVGGDSRLSETAGKKKSRRASGVSVTLPGPAARKYAASTLAAMAAFVSNDGFAPPAFSGIPKARTISCSRGSFSPSHSAFGASKTQNASASAPAIRYGVSMPSSREFFLRERGRIRNGFDKEIFICNRSGDFVIDPA